MKRAGYSAACGLPIPPDSDDWTIDAYLAAAKTSDIVIAEVGAWSNPLDPDISKAKAALQKCKESLHWAERIGARCCVNITGSRHPEKWDGPHPENFSRETFEMIVQTTREIIDAVRPKRTCYTLETMPWIFPSTADEYVKLIRAIDRPGCAVHLDPVNMVTSPAVAYRTSDLIRECFAKLGPMIKSCHAKDIAIRAELTVHLDECPPGQGLLDYGVYLSELARLDPDTTLIIEHLPDHEYSVAAEYIRKAAHRKNLNFL
jgi:sugar phosphate isomerase/epimerase